MGYTIIPAKRSIAIQVNVPKARQPALGLKQKCFSLKTTDINEANRLGEIIGAFVDLGTLPTVIPQVMREAFNISTPQELAGVQIMDSVHAVADRIANVDVDDKASRELAYQLNAMSEKYNKAIRDIEQLNKDLFAANARAIAAEAEAAQYRADAVKKGMALLKDGGALLSELLAPYLAKKDIQSTASHETAWKAFVEFCGDIKLGMLTAEKVEEFFLDMKRKKYSKGYVAKFRKTIFPCLRLAGFNTEACRAYVANVTRSMRDRSKMIKLWLNPQQVAAIIANLDGVWKDAAVLQWSTGFRPSELAKAKVEDFFTDVAGNLRCSLGADMDEDDPDFKTEDARNAIMVEPDALDVTRRVKAGLLFGFKDVKEFNSGYLKAMRAAAKVALPEVDKSEIIGYSLRHSYGKDAILPKSQGGRGKSVDWACAQLRNTEKVFRDHYARWIPSDDYEPRQKA